MPSTAAPQPIGSNLPLISSLPKVSFRRIPSPEAQALALPAGVADHQNIHFGFNDGATFAQPDHYMRYVEPIEADLKKQVEYDMDEQDKEWLDSFNAERKKDQMDTISYEVFEIIIDRLEKEWFDLMRRVPAKPQPAAIGPDGEPVSNNEDTECAICDDGECENSNAIVFCDGCNLAVHQDCYGIPYIPEGQWLCRKCTVSPDRAVSCILCPNEGGAFKQTTLGKWAHLMCAMWIPETGVSNPVYMEPIDSIERIPKARWKLQCYLCHHRHGACIQCENKSCFTAFHVTCARKAGLLLKAERQRAAHSHGTDGHGSDDDDGGEPLQAMCHKHLPKHMRQHRGAFAGFINQSSAANGKARGQFDDDDSSTRASTPVSTPATTKPVSRKFTIRRGPNGAVSAVPRPASTTKSARAYKKSYRAGPPLVPAFVINKVIEYVNKVKMRRKSDVVVLVAKFWSLKREARRGAPLLKRLHLEPWTANVVSKEQTEADRVKRLHFLMSIREDLEKLRMLAELVRKREREKLRQMDLIRKTLVQQVLFPFHAALREATEKIISLDRMNLFLSPVSRTEVPDYYDVVKKPMQWATILARVDEQQYASVHEFTADVQLVLDNALLYNKPETSFHRAALKIRQGCEPILSDLTLLNAEHSVEPSQKILAIGDSVNGAERQDAPAPQGPRLELEPPSWALCALDDYDDDARERSMGDVADDWQANAPANLVRDLVRQWQYPPTKEAAMQAENVSEDQEEEETQSGAPGEHTEHGGGETSTSHAVIGKGDELSTHEASRDDSEPASKRRRTMTNGYSKSSEAAAVLDPSDVPAAHKGDDADALGEPSSSSTSTSKRGRAGSHPVKSRARSSTLGDSDPKGLEVEQLDAWDTFKRFEEGWILPEGSRRARRLTQTLPLFTSVRPGSSEAPSTSHKGGSVNGALEGRGRVKGRSSLSSVSFSDKGANGKGKAEESDLSDLSEEDEDEAESDADDAAASSARKRKRARRNTGNSESLRGNSAATQKRGLHGQFVRKDQSVHQPRKSHGLSEKSPSQAQYGRGRGSRSRVSAADGEEDDGDDDDESAAAPASKMARSSSSASNTSSSVSPNINGSTDKVIHTPRDFPPDTLVWGKLYSFPYFPAEIIAESSTIVPKAVKDSKEPLPAKEPKRSAMHLVRFFDHARSFGWVPTSHLRLLFEDDKLDEKMRLAAKGKHGPGVKKALHKAQLARDGLLEEED